jgi:hypothetical protein
VTPVAAIAQSGLTAATLKLNSSASNLANAGDRSAVGAKGYQPTEVENSALPNGGVVAQAVTLSPGTTIIYDPTAAGAGDRPDQRSQQHAGRRPRVRLLGQGAEIRERGREDSAGYEDLAAAV